MSRGNQIMDNRDVACPHTIKKFELIEAYVNAWARKLLNYKECNGIVFIDCMCNSGIYEDTNGDLVYGTPIRISKLLEQIMRDYPNKNATLYFNDNNAKKIAILQKHIPVDASNFRICTSSMDGNLMLRQLCIDQKSKINYLLIYDPYEAAIDWEALMPFLNIWGEVIVNHMVSDPIRGVSQAKKPQVIAKYEETYKTKIDELLSFNSDRNAYESKIKEIIANQRVNNKQSYFVSSFPFFNRTNSLVYNLIHCSGNKVGCELFKTTAWKTFGGKSSLKNTHGSEDQFIVDMGGSSEPRTQTDDYCYYVKDIAGYLFDVFKGRKEVPIEEVFSSLEIHPIFPSEGFRTQIKQELKGCFNVTISKSSMTFI